MLSHIPPTYPAANQPSSPNKCSPSPLASARLPARLQRGTIKLVPRLDLAGMAARKPEDARSNFGKQPKVKPPARPFNPDEVRCTPFECMQGNTSSGQLAISNAAPAGRGGAGPGRILCISLCV